MILAQHRSECRLHSIVLTADSITPTSLSPKPNSVLLRCVKNYYVSPEINMRNWKQLRCYFSAMFDILWDDALEFLNKFAWDIFGPRYTRHIYQCWIWLLPHGIRFPFLSKVHTGDHTSAPSNWSLKLPKLKCKYWGCQRSRVYNASVGNVPTWWDNLNGPTQERQAKEGIAS